VNVVDSSAWLEYFSDGPNAPDFAATIEDPEYLAVPVLTLYEVFKRICQIKDETIALDAVAVMLQGRVVTLTGHLALHAARVSLENGLAMEDAIILATARAEEATLWTQDAHFAGMDRVEYRKRTP
jgi:predicted nucleic acid-binding protein